MTHGQVPSSTPGHLKTNDDDDGDISLRERNECRNEQYARVWKLGRAAAQEFN